MKLNALIFDFDGVVVDSEPIHLTCFRRVLEPAGVKLAEEDYYGKYLGMDDHDCFAAAGRDNGVAFTDAQLAALTAEKTRLVKRAFSESIRPLPGAAELIHAAAAAGVPLAVCSGALREEIELAAGSIGVLACFGVIVSAEDVRRGKPDPEGYRLALERLAEAAGRQLSPDLCVVVEDAPAGVSAAKAVGMNVLAVTNSYAADRLGAADRVVPSLAELTPDSLAELLWPKGLKGQ